MTEIRDRWEMVKKYSDVLPPYYMMWGDKFIDFRNQPRWDIPEVVVLGVAVVGVFIDREQNPKIPIFPDEIRSAIEDCVDIGAVSVHMHVRDDRGRPSASLENFHKVIDPLRGKYGDSIVVDGGCMTGKTFPEAVGPVTDGLFEMSIVNPSTGLLGDNLRAMSPATMKAQAAYFRECGVRPLIDVHDTGSIENAKRYLIDEGLIDPPYIWHLLPGLPGTMHFPNPRAMTEGLLFLVNRIREIDPDSVIMVSDPGRCTIYLSTLAMLLGLHVRVGMEDTLWKYPHRDEMIESSREAIEATKEIAHHLGRRPATAEEFRELAGIEKPWSQTPAAKGSERTIRA
ncbi:MAG: 3-keto-5-aminohexanoate cleavage protein [Nitrospinota bacterium]